MHCVRQQGSVLTCSVPQRLELSQLPAEGASSQGHSLEPRHVHSFIRLRSAVALLSGHRISSPTPAAPPCVILFNLNWCLLECPVKCVKSKDVTVLLETVGT